MGAIICCCAGIERGAVWCAVVCVERVAEWGVGIDVGVLGVWAEEGVEEEEEEEEEDEEEGVLTATAACCVCIVAAGTDAAAGAVRSAAVRGIAGVMIGSLILPGEKRSLLVCDGIALDVSALSRLGASLFDCLDSDLDVFLDACLDSAVFSVASFVTCFGVDARTALALPLFDAFLRAAVTTAAVDKLSLALLPPLPLIFASALLRSGLSSPSSSLSDDSTTLFRLRTTTLETDLLTGENLENIV